MKNIIRINLDVNERNESNIGIPLPQKVIRSKDTAVIIEMRIIGYDVNDGYTFTLLSEYTKSKRHTLYTIGDRLKIEGNVVTFVPPAELISTLEIVTNTLYIEKSGVSLDFSKFHYLAQLSEVDNTVGPVKEVYDDNYQALIDELEFKYMLIEDLTAEYVAAQVAEARVGADGTIYRFLKERLDVEHQIVTAQVGEVSNRLELTNNEIIDARGGKPTLRVRLNEIDRVDETGKHWTLIDGEWEERVGQTQLINVRGEVAWAMAEAEQAREDAIKAYEDAVAEAKRSADIEDALIRTKIEQDISAVETEMVTAKQEAKDAANQALEDAKAHADAEVERINTELSTEVGDAIDLAEEAKQDAIDKANQALSDAKDHADAEVQASKEYFDSIFEEVESDVADAQSTADSAVEQIDTAVVNAGFTSLDETISNVQAISNQAHINSSTAIDNAQDAMDSASTAITNAGQAISDASQAKNDAQTAVTQAGQAVSSANTAKTNAQTAIDDAQSALATAGNAKTTADTLTVTVNDLEGEVELKANQTEVDGISGTVSTHTTTLSQHADAIASKAEKSVVDTLSGTVTNQETLISQNATAITSKADTSTVDTLAGTVSTQGTTITQQADLIESKANQTEVDTVKGTVATHTTTISQHADQIASKAESSLVNTIKGTVDTHTTEISQNSTDIATKASSASVNTLTGRVDTAETGISQNADAIKLKASQSSVDTLAGTVSTLGSEFDVVAGQVSSRVWKTDIETAIDETGFTLDDKTEVLSGTEIFTDKADDDAVVHVEIDGKSYQEEIILNNLTVNGNFSKGKESWHFSSELTILNYNDGITYTNALPVSIYPRNDTEHLVPGRKYYTRAVVKAPETVYLRIAYSQTSINITRGGEWEVLSDIAEVTEPSEYPVSFRTRSEHVSNVEISIKYVMVIDLTQSYGKGNEPTKSEMDGFFETYNISYFEDSIRIKNFIDVDFQSSIPSPDQPIEINDLGNFDIVSSMTPAGENSSLIDKVNLVLDEPLRSVGDISDKLFRDADGLWKIERIIRERRIDGSETWVHEDNGLAHTYRASWDIWDSADGLVLSNMFIGIRTGTSILDNEHIIMVDSQVYVRVNKNRLSSNTLTGFKAYMAELNREKGPIYFQYVMYRPLFEILSDEYQDKLNNLRSFQDSNYVYTTFPDKTDTIPERLKPTLHATFKGGGWYYRWKTHERMQYVESEWTQTFDSFSQTVSGINGQVSEQKQTLEGITSTVSGHGDRISTVEQTAEGIQSTVADKANQSQVTQLSDGLSAVVSKTDQISEWTRSYRVTTANPLELLDIDGSQLDKRFSYEIILGTTGTGVVTNFIASLTSNSATNAWTLTVHERSGTTGQHPYVYLNSNGNPMVSLSDHHAYYHVAATVKKLVSRSKTSLTMLSDNINLRVSKGDVLSQINIEAERTLIQSNKLVLDAASVVFTGNAFIPSAQIESVHADKITAGTIKTARLDASDIVTNGLTTNVVKSTHIETSTATIDKLFVNETMINRLTSKTAFINSIKAVTIDAGKITSGTISSARIDATTIVTNGLAANVVSSNHIIANEALVDKVFSNQASVDRLWAKNIWANKITAMEIDAGKITSGTINAARLNVTDLRSKILTANVIDATQINGSAAVFNKLFSTSSATSRLVAQGAWITNANIESIDASKITAGTISADRISTNSLANAVIGGRNYFYTSLAATSSRKALALEPNTQYILSTDLPKRPDGGVYIFAGPPGFVASSATNGAYYGNSVSVTTTGTGIVEIVFSQWDSSWIVNGEYHVQLEKGDKATAWTPAPEDIVDVLGTNGSVEIHGGNIKADTLDVGAITGDLGEFINLSLKAQNSQASLSGASFRIESIANNQSYIEMSNAPEIRARSADSSMAVMGQGRTSYHYDGSERFYFGSRLNGWQNGMMIRKHHGWGIMRESDSSNGVPAKYYTVPAGYQRVAVIEALMRDPTVTEVPTGNETQFIINSNYLGRLNGYTNSTSSTIAYPWPTLRTGDLIKYAEEIPGNESGVQQVFDIWDDNNTTVSAFGVHVTFHGGYSGASDRNIKHDIKDTAVEALAHIESLTFKEFRYNQDNRYEPIGMIAQDSGILRVKSDKVESIDIQRSIMLSLKGLQELQDIVKRQAEEINEQAEEIKQLKEIINQ